MIRDFINNEGKYVIDITNINGTYWVDDLYKIIQKKIDPSKLEKKDLEDTWDYSEYEFSMEKDEIKFKLNINDDTFGHIVVDEEPVEENKEKLREWATIIAEEIERLE